MGTKISALTETGSAPTGAYYPLEYDNANYKISTETLRANLGGKYTADWAQSHGGVTVANGATLTITHNLGTTDICVSAFANASASDVGADGLDAIINADPGGFTYGVFITSLIDENSFVLQLADTGYGACDSSGSAIVTPFTDKFLKVVVLSAGSTGTNKYVEGFATSIGGTAVDDAETLTVTHNLGTEDVIVVVYVADDAAGTNAHRVNTAIYTGGIDGGNATAMVEGWDTSALTTNTVTIQLGSNGYWPIISSSGTAIIAEGSTTTFSGAFLKVVVIG